MKKKIIEKIRKLPKKYSPVDILNDLVEMLAIAIQNGTCLLQDELWKKREQQYIGIISKYDRETQHEFEELCAMMTIAYEKEGACDLLGEIYMEAGCGNKQAGQFFTPFNVSELCAGIAFQEISEKNRLKMYEPNAGAGGMVLAAAKELNKRGINYQTCMDVIAQDLDWKGVYMSYVQFSLLGIPAVVVQGDTLEEPFTDILTYPKERVFITPKKAGLF